MAYKKNMATVGNLCVACGTCVLECPFGAIQIQNGTKASVDLEKCVGCGKCSKVCPASVIIMVKREVKDET